MTDASSGLPPAAPPFAQHFTHPLYDDAGDEFAPFGSDEGSDLLAQWAERRDELDAVSTLATVLGCAPEEVAELMGPMEGVDGLETAMFVVSGAFVLLRLAGHLAEADRQLALDALDFQMRVAPDADSPPAVLRIQREDLASWRNPV